MKVYYLYCALIKLGAGDLGAAFDVANVDFEDPFGESVLEPLLADCVAQWASWGVRLSTMRAYSRRPDRYPYADTPDFDCAWGCFFESMGWLDDIEGTFRAYIMLYDMELYVARRAIDKAKIAASRCIYVNFPHRPPAGPAPDCEQAKLLKDCFILETVQNITAEDKSQFKELLQDWAWICAESWGVPMELVRRQVRRRPASAAPAGDPPELGCVWRCLFYDMGWIGPRTGMFYPIIVLETIKLYYGVEDKISQLVDVASHCIAEANNMAEEDNGLPNGCGRSSYLVDCLLGDFFYKDTVLTNQHGGEEQAKDTGEHARAATNGTINVH